MHVAECALHFNLVCLKLRFLSYKKKIIIITCVAVYYFVVEYFRENDILTAFVRPVSNACDVDARDPRPD